MLSFDLGGLFSDLIGHPKEAQAYANGQIGVADAYADAQTQMAAFQSQAATERNRVIMIVAVLLIIMFSMVLILKK